ncbi:DUF222 domain-containing protein [Desertimonas flava]|uniref:DUF222 domain-containing protein n=1 Tax=Desertimonas flava TaxID=2064846 RepID=UPI000E3548DB|nr:DUF222 domain-containing protein [Desertimonas flava]
MAPGDRPDLDRLTDAVDALGAAFANLAVETFSTEVLKNCSLQVSRAANMVDGIRADLARKERALRPPAGAVAPPAGRSLDPKGHRPGRQQERDSERSDLFDELPDLGDATRRGDLSGAYADAVNLALARLSAIERAAFYTRSREALTQKALTTDLHGFRVHVRELVDDFDRARQLERFQQQRASRRGSTWTDHATGMTNLFATFDPETGARVKRAIDHEIDRLYRAKRDDPNDTRSHQQVVADAIGNLITGARATNERSTDLVVLIDLYTLVTDDSPTGDSSTCTSPADAGADMPPPSRPGRCCEPLTAHPFPSKPCVVSPATPASSRPC